MIKNGFILVKLQIIKMNVTGHLLILKLKRNVVSKVEIKSWHGLELLMVV